ncbi:MAG: DUF4838 domain-containing protein [Planctomycetota bacterium]|jgi:hypothetical protein
MKKVEFNKTGLIVILVAALLSPTLSAVDYLITYKGVNPSRSYEQINNSTKQLHTYMQRVLKSKIKRPIEFDKIKDKKTKGIVFFLTEEKYLPAGLAKSLKGKKKDAFIIKYPVTIEGQSVCLMASRDFAGYDYPVYYFLNKFMDVNWVGPGEIGKIVPENPAWQMPEKINVLENPDYEMRLWSGSMLEIGRPLLAHSGRMDFHHAFGRIYHPKKYAATDPDIYPLIDGKRYVPDPNAHHATSGWQPCLSNPKVENMAVDYVLKQYETNPRIASVSLSVNDGKQIQELPVSVFLLMMVTAIIASVRGVFQWMRETLLDIRMSRI